MSTRIDEIAPDTFRISIYVERFSLQFNHFLIRDEEPLLYHTGMRGMFPQMREAVATLIDPATLRWISWSHFEVDECGALNEWLAVAPHATPAVGELGAMINVADFSNRPPRGLKADDVLETGRHRFRFVQTPHLPHGWDAGVLFDQTNRVLFCSDLMHQLGEVGARDRGRYRRPVAAGARDVSADAADGLPAVHRQHREAARDPGSAPAPHAGGDAPAWRSSATAPARSWPATRCCARS